MSDTYVKVGVNLTRYLYYQNLVTGAPVTGAVAANFTIQITKNGTGNQSTTGITGPTEVDSTNNQGVYSLSLSGSTSFLAATGIYEVKVYVTATTELVWNETLYVTSDGTGAGTYGAASFTAVAANGRVMSGGSPLQGATVTILTPAGTIYVQTTSDASGLWGPVYFNANGTYAVQVQKTGYTTTSGSIVVTGSTATGPGADLSITAVSTGSTLLVSTLMSYLRRIFLDASSAKSDTIILEIINEAAEMVFMEMQWPYWNRPAVIELLEPYDTGTLTLTNGSDSVSFSGATLPAWVDSGCDIFIPSMGTWFPIETRDSSSAVTIRDTYNGTTSAGLEYSLSKIRYALPTQCARTNDLLFGAQWPYQPRSVSAAKLAAMKDVWQTNDQWAGAWAVESACISVFPPPLIYKRVNFYCFMKPLQVTSGSDTLDFPPEQVLLLRKALNYCASMRGAVAAGTSKETKDAYDAAKGIALNWDQTTTNITPENAGELFNGPIGPFGLGWLGPVSG